MLAIMLFDRLSRIILVMHASLSHARETTLSHVALTEHMSGSCAVGTNFLYKVCPGYKPHSGVVRAVQEEAKIF